MYAIGLDVGGTKIAGGIVEADGTVLKKCARPFPGANAVREISASDASHTTAPGDTRAIDSVSVMETVIQTLLAETGLTMDQVESVGVAVPGSIDYAAMSVIDAHNLGYHNFPLRDELMRRFPGVPVLIENDANAAALAEYFCGAFRGVSSGLLITLGTGVGAGLILKRRIFTGGMKNGCEFGHATLVFDGEPCTCGNLGCIESYCSATALIRDGRRAAAAHPDSGIAVRSGGDPANIDAKLIIDCAREGDTIARQLFDRYARYVGAAVVSAFNAFDPEVVAIGGGVSNAGDFLFDRVRAYAEPRAFFKRHGTIVPALLGNDAGFVGAAMLHRQGRTED